MCFQCSAGVKAELALGVMGSVVLIYAGGQQNVT